MERCTLEFPKRYRRFVSEINFTKQNVLCFMKLVSSFYDRLQRSAQIKKIFFKMSKANYSFNMKLAKVVEQHPILYNFHLPEYSKREALSIAWENVANEMNTTAQECKEAWRLLRITYTRSIKLPASGSAAKKLTQKTQNMIKEMNFIRPYVNAKNSQDLPSNLPPLPSPEHENDAEDVVQFEQNLDVDGGSKNEDNSLIILQPKTDSIIKKKKNTPNNDDIDSCVMEYIKKKGQQKTEENPKKLFLLSLLPDLDSMNDFQMRSFRTKVSALIDNVLSTQQNISSTPASVQSQHNCYGEDTQYECPEWLSNHNSSHV